MDENRVKTQAFLKREPLRTPNLTFPRLTQSETLQLILDSTEPLWIDFVNAHTYISSIDSLELSAALKNVDLLLNDGVGLEWLSKAYKKPFLENLNGTDFLPFLLDSLKKNGARLFLIGGKESIGKRACEKIKIRWPQVEVCGYQSGYFSQEEESRLLEEIAGKMPTIIIVCMGVPHQTLFVHRNLRQLKNSGANLIICAGGWVDFISESTSRAPKWMRKLKFEWVYRFLLEPKRLFKRYFFGNIRMLWQIFKAKLRLL